jgi:hypothetical protein
MLVTIPQIRSLIREVITGEAGYVDQAVVDILSNVPSGFIRPGGYVDVEPDELKRAVKELIEYAASQGPGVHVNTVQAAMNSNVCHYLWFC